MAHTIHSIDKETFELGEDFAICCKCGAHLRHYVKSTGEVYGLDCARSSGLIGKKMTAKKMKHISWEIDTFKRMYQENTAKESILYSWARRVDIALGLNIPNSKIYSSLVYEAVK